MSLRPRRIMYDFHGDGRGPEPGDFIQTTRSVYAVITSRLVVRRELVSPGRRYMLEVEKVPALPKPIGVRALIFPLRWYPRGSRRRSASNARQRRANV